MKVLKHYILLIRVDVCAPARAAGFTLCCEGLVGLRALERKNTKSKKLNEANLCGQEEDQMLKQL